MQHTDTPPRQGAGDRATITVGLFDAHAEVLQRVAALAARSPALNVRVLSDSTTSTLPNDLAVLVVGLDTDPAAALKLARRVTALPPACRVIVYGQESSKEILPQAMAAGAQRYLTYPFTATALHEAIVAVQESLKQLVASAHPIMPEGAAGTTAAEPRKEGKVIALFSPKGGVGTTTLAVNLACALARLGRSVALVDANISFGNVGVILDLVNASTMLALAGDPEKIRGDSVDDLLVPHDSGVRVLLAPTKPDEAESIEDEHLRRIIAALRPRYEYVVVDTWASYDSRVLAVLECADRVLVPTTPDLQAVKNLTAFLRVADLLHLSSKLSLVMMRVDSVNASYLRQIQEFLDRPIAWTVVSDGKRVIKSVVAGTPFVLKEPGARISRDIQRIARDMDGQTEAKSVPKRRAAWRPARLRLKPAP